MYAKFGQKKEFDDLTSLTGEIVDFPSNKCQISIHIGMAMK